MNEYLDFHSPKLSVKSAQSLFTDDIDNSFASGANFGDEWKNIEDRTNYFYSLTGFDYQQLVFTGLEHFTDPAKQLNLDF